MTDKNMYEIGIRVERERIIKLIDELNTGGWDILKRLKQTIKGEK